MSDARRNSVVIPCHNAEPYLAQAIGSALDQTSPPHEVIVIDDGSTDGSLEVARRFERSWPDVVRVEEAHYGRASRARNLGALLATGDGLLFLDADDVLGPEALNALGGALSERPGGVAVCPWFRLQRIDGRWIEQPPSCTPRAAGQDPLSAWLTGWYHPPCSVLWSRRAFEDAGRWDEQATVNDDGDLMMRALVFGTALLETPSGTAYYRRRADGATSLSGTRLTRSAIASRLRIIRKIAFLLEAHGKGDRYRQPLDVALGIVAGDAAGRHPDLSEQAGALARQYGTPRRQRATRLLLRWLRPRRAGRGSNPRRGTAERQFRPREVLYGLDRAGQALRSAPALRAPGPPGRSVERVRPTVTVIIPTFNRADLLPRALGSVLTQTFDDFEALVVDDGSTDTTATVMAQCADPRVRYLRQPRNAGVSAARNRGLQDARGQFIAFLDSDDEWMPEKLSRQVELFRSLREEVGLVYTGVESVRPDGSTRVECSRVRGDVWREMLWRNAIHGGGSNVMIRREVVAAAGFFREGLAAIEDYEYWLRVTRFFEVEYIDAPLIRYYDPPWTTRRSLALQANLEARWWLYRTHAAEMRRAGVAHLFLVNTGRWALLFPRPDVRAARRLAARAVMEKPVSRIALAMLMRTMAPRAAAHLRWVQRHAAID